MLANSYFPSAFRWRELLKELGDYDTLNGRICTLKEAAQQMVDARTPVSTPEA